MKLQFLVPGKTKPDFFREGLEFYAERIRKHTSFKIIEAQQPRTTGKETPEQVKELEARYLQKHIDQRDYLIVLDERGKEFTSVQLSENLQRWMNIASGNIVFLAGGAWGISPSLLMRANEKIALSQLTLPHQLVRILFAEQLYRAFTILDNHPYHH